MDCVVVGGGVWVWWNIIDVIVYLLVLTMHQADLFVNFRWSVKISWRMGLLEMVLLWVSSGPSQLPVH